MRVLIRCDGGGEQGVGHVIRSLALAEEAAARGHDVLVAGAFEGDFVRRQLDAAPVTVLALPPHTRAEGIDSPLPLLQEHPVDVLHVDHSEVHGALAHGLRAGMPDGVLLSNVEDGDFGRRPAHLVVDPTWGSEGAPRPVDGSRWLLRGAEYAAMRRQVTRRRGEHD
ncbi:MAG: bifunctional UDP-2,4-diacetamido-2,4,6-trideoxy-beta-L-altropyranose hydrolase/GNAT family N-acetyltransferase, partial [Oryzihumus sp.]